MDTRMESNRQLILLCDGTNNNLTGRKADTHVLLLAEVLRQQPDPQRLVYYDPGVGNPGQLPGTTVVDKFGRLAERLNGLAFGRGVFDNIAEGYFFLMRNWRPGVGWMLPLAAGADLCENLLTLLTLAAAQLHWMLLTWPLRVLVFAASLAKWAGLAGVAVLLVAGAARWLWFRSRKRSLPQPSVAPG
jgi:hypothetical protein